MTIISSFVVAYVLNAVWEVPLLALAAEITTHMLRGMRAAIIHRIWVGCLFLAIMLPAASFLRQSDRGFGAMMLAIPSVDGTPSLITERVDKRGSANALQDYRSARSGYEKDLGFRWRAFIPNSICLLYLASILFPVSKLAKSLVGARNLLRTAKPVLLGPDLQKAWKTCLATFELTEVGIMSSVRLSSPATLNWLKPIVVLPKDLQGAGIDEMVAAFCHELAHVRRGDFVLNLLYEAAATLLFFHPVLHWILRRLGEGRELACDDLAADAMEGRRIYAKNLLLLAQRMSPAATRLTCALGVLDTGLMEKRVMNLIGNKPSQTSLHVGTSIIFGTVLLTSTCGLCAFFGLTPVLAQTTSSSDHAPSGWFLAGSKPANYRTGVDKGVLHDGLPSAYLASSTQDTGGFGTLMQSIEATQYAGKRVRLRGWLRSRDVTSWAGLWMRVDKGQTMVGFDNMEKRAIRGTRQWTMCDVVLDVPPDATGISFGTLLSGPGELWLNDVKFDVVGQNVPTTAEASGRALPTTPVNLGFQK
jgi:beta-lactamase regulating signal transducer with metallopeptidase domain